MTCGIYSITNVSNGMLYIGQTRDLEGRWAKHLSCLRRGNHSNPKLQNSWNKYGEPAFRYAVIETLICSDAELDELETRLIDEIPKALKFNIKRGGSRGDFGPEWYEKTASATRAWVASAEGRAAFLKRSAHPGWIKNNAEANRNKGPKFLENLAKATFGNPVWRQENAERNRARANNPDWLRENAERNRRRSTDPEWLRRNAAQNAKTAQTPEWRAKAALATSRRTADEGWRINVAAAARRSGIARARAVQRADTREIYPSVRPAALAMGVGQTAIRNAIRLGHKCGGTGWEFVVSEQVPT